MNYCQRFSTDNKAAAVEICNIWGYSWNHLDLLFLALLIIDGIDGSQESSFFATLFLLEFFSEMQIKKQVFQLARKSPQQLSKDINFIPHIGFQWSDDNQVLMKVLCLLNCFSCHLYISKKASWSPEETPGLVQLPSPEISDNLLIRCFIGA